MEPSFIIGLHAKDLPLFPKWLAGPADLRINYLPGCFALLRSRKNTIFFWVLASQRGKISIGNNNNAVFYYVSSVQELTNVIIPHFDNYPLLTQKQGDFILFKSALDIINDKGSKKPLTLEYLNKLIAIKGSLNWGLSCVLKKAFPDIAAVSRPEVELPKFISPKWLAGFIDGEGCFYILTSKSKLYKTGTSVQLQFSRGSAPSRDKNLMIRLKDFLNCGFIKEGKKQPVVSFNVTKFSDIQNIIIPLLEKNPLQGIKYKDFVDSLRTKSCENYGN